MSHFEVKWDATYRDGGEKLCPEWQSWSRSADMAAAGVRVVASVIPTLVWVENSDS